MSDFLLDAAIDVARTGTGLFFVISGYHKLFNAQRHATLVDTLKACHVPFVGFNQWWVPGWEFAGGLMVVSGWPPAVILGSAALMVICAIACLTDGRKRVKAFRPIDPADCVDDWLYLPESLYVLLLSIAAAEALSILF